MQERRESFRRQVAELNEGQSGRRRFTPELRAEALSYFTLRKEEGASIEEVIAELGVSRSALEKWRGGSVKKSKRFVRVRSQPALESLVFETPSGHRVRGLRLEDVIHLIERFS